MAHPTTATVGAADGTTPFRIITNGRERWLVDPLTGVLIGKIDGTQGEPTELGKLPCFFFRLSGGKQQVCVKFLSGATQILATEP